MTLNELRWKKFPVLNDGFVCLVDVMGDDAAICQAARTSYGNDARDGETSAEKDDRHLIRYLMRHRHCYAPSMQVLTARGWLAWGDCRPEETFLVPDPDTRSLRPEKLVVESFHTDEGLYTFHNERMSYAVTPDHKMWFQGKYQKQFSAVPVKEMLQWGHFDPLRDYTVVDNKGCCPRTEFAAFWLGDGYLASTNRIGFNFKKSRKVTYLQTLLETVGIPDSSVHVATKNGVTKFHIAIPKWLRFILGKAMYEKAATKYLPMWNLTNAAWCEAVIRGLSSSDGYFNKDREQCTFSSASPSLIRLWEAANAAIGVDAHWIKSGYGVSSSTAYTGTRTSLESRKQHHNFREYTGPVYCTTTSTGWLMVRGGNDKFAFVCGNSTPFEMAEVKLLVRVPMDCWRQWVRC